MFKVATTNGPTPSSPTSGPTYVNLDSPPNSIYEERPQHTSPLAPGSSGSHQYDPEYGSWSPARHSIETTTNDSSIFDEEPTLDSLRSKTKGQFVTIVCIDLYNYK